MRTHQQFRLNSSTRRSTSKTGQTPRVSSGDSPCPCFPYRGLANHIYISPRAVSSVANRGLCSELCSSVVLQVGPACISPPIPDGWKPFFAVHVVRGGRWVIRLRCGFGYHRGPSGGGRICWSGRSNIRHEDLYILALSRGAVGLQTAYL